MTTTFDDTFFNRMQEAAQKAALSVGSTARALVVDRVFGRGGASDGTKIGDYSKSPVYVGASSFLTKSGANKVLGSKKKRKALYGAANASGKAQFVPKSRPGSGGKGAIYFPKGYKGIREADGRQTAFVDLRYTGQMQNDFQMLPFSEGFQLGFLTSNNGAKMRGNEARFGKEIISMTDGEIDTILTAYNDEFARMFSR